MRLIRFILIAILFCSAIWGSLVFFGPAAIEKISKIYFGEAIVLKHVKVSPSLSLSVGRVEFDFEKNNSFQHFAGVAVGLNVKISLFGKNPYFETTTKKLSLYDLGSLDGGSILIKPKSIFNWNDSNMEFFASSFGLTDVAEIKSLYLKSRMNFALRKFQQLKIKTSNFVALDTFYPNVQSALGSIDNYSFDQNIAKQELSGQLFLEGLTSDYGSSLARSAELSFVVQDERLLLESTIPEIRANEYGLLADELALSASMNIENFSLTKPVEINSKFIRQEEVGLEIDNAKLDVAISDGATLLSSTGNILSLELYSDDQYLGSLSDTKFEMTSSFKTKNGQSEVLADFQLYRQIAIPTNAGLKVSGLINENNFYSCKFVECNFQRLNFDYFINLEREFLKGTSECVIKKCYLNDLIHKVSIKNTAKFFDNLGKSRIFSPFILAVLYSNAISGKPVGGGHLISLP